MRSLAAILFALLVPAALLAVFNRGVTTVDLPATWIAAAALLGGAALTWGWRSERRGARVVAALALTAAGSAALSEQAMIFLNWRWADAPPSTVTAVVEAIEARGFAPGDDGACAVVLQPWRAGMAPLRLALAGSTLLRDPAAGNAVLCRTAEASVVRRGERVAVRVARGALGVDFLAALDGHAVLTPPCSTCGTHAAAGETAVH